MKTIRKLLAVAMTMFMVLAVSTVALAAGTGSITITPPADTPAGAENEYKIYKVFDADGDGTNISYKKKSNKAGVPAGFTVDDYGYVTTNLTALDQTTITAIANYVNDDDDLVATVTSTGPAAAVAEGLPNGYYYITTSTGTAVTIDSTNPNAEVNDKNTVPGVTKIHATDQDAAVSIIAAQGNDASKRAIAQVGKPVTFSATVTFGNGSKNVKFHDTMGTGLALIASSITVSDNLTSSQYTIRVDNPDEGDTFTIDFANGIAESVEATITYQATVTSDALQVNPAKNTATVSYGDKNIKTPPSETEDYNAKISVIKKDGADDSALSGAGFKLKNSDNKFYKLSNNEVSWVDEAEADQHVSDSDGNVPAFTGLTAGTYYLVETQVPAGGYNRASDTEVTIAANDYSEQNLIQTQTVKNNKGTELPSTGGIGTTIFYIVGAILLIGGGIMFVTKKRVAKIEDES